MALGTESIAPVQKVVGPGNVYVTAAKQLLQDRVEIDFPAGPSEIAIVADATARPEYIAADLLAQAEHDTHAAALLITTEPALADDVGRKLEAMAARANRSAIVNKALDNCGYVLVDSLADAALAVDRIAPEHLSIQVADPLAMLAAVHNAGSIFLGPYSPAACGDYGTGTNHVLPTSGHAATRSGLDVRHFCKTATVQRSPATASRRSGTWSRRSPRQRGSPHTRPRSEFGADSDAVPHPRFPSNPWQSRSRRQHYTTLLRIVHCPIGGLEGCRTDRREGRSPYAC